jgi:hypothetical protein
MKALMLLLLLVTLSFAVFYGNDYPEELKLFDDIGIDDNRPIVDVEYYFNGKIVVSKFGINRKDLNLVDLYFEINTGDGRVAVCEVSNKAYRQYEIGDTVGVTVRDASPIKEEIESSKESVHQDAIDSLPVVKEESAGMNIGDFMLMLLLGLCIAFASYLIVTLFPTL